MKAIILILAILLLPLTASADVDEIAASIKSGKITCVGDFCGQGKPPRLPAAADYPEIHAACPDIPAAERVRIVKCTDETYAVQELRQVLCLGYPRAGGCQGWATEHGCGHTIEEARGLRRRHVLDLMADEVINCPSEPPKVLDPVVVVE